MLLNELTGIKHLKQKSALEILQFLDDQVVAGKSDIEIIGNGANGMAIRLGNYVYKFWVKDSGYENFINYCLKNQGDKYIPTIHGKRIRTLPIDILGDGSVIKYVKMDLLEEFYTSDGDLEITVFKDEHPFPHTNKCPVVLLLDWISDYSWPDTTSYKAFMEPLMSDLCNLFETISGEKYWVELYEKSDPMDLLTDELNGLCKHLFEISKFTGGETFLDVKLGNIMKDKNGELVILDPLANNSDIELNSIIFNSVEDFFE